jgi:hypothetical protein
MTAAGAAKSAKPRVKNINIFSTADLPSGQVKSSGIRPNAKAVVSAMPVVKAKPRARITAIFFMAVPLFSNADIARTGQGLP